jgi:hypothetical protein
MDVHPKRSQIAVLDAAGGVQRNRNLSDDQVKLVPVVGVLPPGTPVAFEAAYGWGWLVELLEELELEPHLVHPSCGKAIAAARLKNDKVDARTLASCCGPTCSPRPGSPHRSLDRSGGFQIGSGDEIAASTTTSGQARLPMGRHNGTATSSHPTVNPDGNTVTGPGPGPDQYREGYRQLRAPVPVWDT